MKNHYLLCTAAALSALLAGCTKPGDETPPPSPEIIVSAADATIPVAADATSCVIEYELRNAGENDVVEAVSDAEWLEVGEITPDAVRLTFTANTEEQAREGKVTLSAKGAKSVDVTIQQAAAEAPEEPEVTIVLEEGSEEISADPQGNDENDESDVLTAYYTIEGGQPGIAPKASADVDWIVITDVFPAYTDFRVLRNNGDEAREGHIVISFQGAEDVSVLVKQDVMGKPVITISETQPYEVVRQGSADPIYVRFSVENLRDGENVTAEPDVDWIEMTTVQSGYMGFTVKPNDGDERTGNIRLSYRDAEPVDFVVIQDAALEGDGLVVTVADVTATSVTVNVQTFIEETYSTGVIPKAELDAFGNDKAFLDELVRQMKNEYESSDLADHGVSFASYFGLSDSDESVSFGTDPYGQKLLSDTDYYAFAFDLSADENNIVSYSGTLYKVEFRTLPAEEQEDMSFTFSFNEKNKLVCTPSDLERPYCLIVFGTSMDRYTEGMTPEQIADTYQSQAAYCEYFTGVGTSTVYLGSYDSPYTAYAFGYDQALGERTSSITVYEFAYPPEETAASSVILNRSR